MSSFILTLENPYFLCQEGGIITPKGIIKIFRIENHEQERLFQNGIICPDINDVFEIAEEIQQKALKQKK